MSLFRSIFRAQQRPKTLLLPAALPIIAYPRTMSSVTGHEHLKAANLFKMDGLVAVVTGGASGIGLMQTVAMAENGAKVFITGRREEKLEDVAKKYSSGQIIPVAGDITSKDGIKAVVDEIKNQSPNGINILCNNAGVAGEGSREGYEQSDDANKISEQLLRSEFAEWDKILQTNVTAQYFTAASFLPLLALGKKNTPGYSSQIINTSSISGFLKSSGGGQFAYQASKAAMIQMTRAMALEFSKTGIRCNQIAPGIFPSEMTAGKSDEETHKNELHDKGKGLPAHRAGSEDDMAAAILYLASYAGCFVNGQAIVPDGGATATSPSVN